MPNLRNVSSGNGRQQSRQPLNIAPKILETGIRAWRISKAATGSDETAASVAAGHFVVTTLTGNMLALKFDIQNFTRSGSRGAGGGPNTQPDSRCGWDGWNNRHQELGDYKRILPLLKWYHEASRQLLHNKAVARRISALELKKANNAMNSLPEISQAAFGVKGNGLLNDWMTANLFKWWNTYGEVVSWR